MIRPRIAAVCFVIALFGAAGCGALSPGEDESIGPRSTTAADGTTIDYEVAGGGSPALVFLHGWAADRGVWKKQFERFARSNRVIAIDLARKNDAGGGRLDWSIDALAADVASVLDHENLIGVVIVGHSLGAIVGIEAAAREPNRVAAVVGIEALHDVERSQTAEVTKFVEQLERDWPGTIQQAVPRSFGPKADIGDVGRVVKSMKECDPAIGIALERSYAEFDFAAALDQMQVPLRLINARPTNIAVDRRHARDFSVVSMAGVGFFPMLEDPDTFAGVLVTVLEELRVKDWLGPQGAVPERTGPSPLPKHE